MARAIDLARQGWGRTFPNPLVGAVVAHGERVVGSGAHTEFGGPHAEAVALAEAGSAARGATLYVTLEPCAHTGKQPPCTAAITRAGIARVVMAMRDPNPVASGGAEQLRSAGIPADIGVMEAEAARLNFRFLRHLQPGVRPFVAVKLAVTMDGFIADSNGASKWISGEAARDWVHWLRAGFAGIAVGGHTAVADQARLTVRGAITPREHPVRVVFDRSGRVPLDHPLYRDVATARVVVIVDRAVAVDRRAELESAGAEVLVSDSLAESLTQLRARGVDALLVEGGGRLASAFLSVGLVDRVYQIQSPAWMGAGIAAWQQLEARRLPDLRRWHVVDASVLGRGSDVTDALFELEP
ncbi:MAG: bifunctional diaminohydroxyphosphoribosylaminopyrimidine deaminase/5-amino-6-(5-phosphoribosylamino)uracil reductase RibD [Gemmatimonadales bacterium]